MRKEQIDQSIQMHLEETEGENAVGTFDDGYEQGVSYAMSMYERLDLPEKPVVPSYIAEWFEKNKFLTLDVQFRKIENHENKNVRDWYNNCDGSEWSKMFNAQKIIAKMSIYGYEIEKETLFYMPVPYSDVNNYYIKFKGKIHTCVKTSGATGSTKFTQLELNKYFPEITHMAIPVEGDKDK